MKGLQLTSDPDIVQAIGMSRYMTGWAINTCSLPSFSVHALPRPSPVTLDVAFL